MLDKASMATYGLAMNFATYRLSKHFTLLDFLQAHTLYTSGMAVRDFDVPVDCIETGRRLCNELLEPMVERFGPCSISSGFIPKRLLSDRWTPHTWFPRDGAAIDASFHDWVNEEKAPIKLIEEVVRARLPFERIITYAGSEFICLSAGRQPANRGVIYENIRLPGEDKPKFRTVCRPGGAPTLSFPDRPDWRRMDEEPVYHTQRKLRAHHVRVGRYFTLLDFCRDEASVRAGQNWVPPVDNKRIAGMARCMAEVLDEIVPHTGRLSVVQGIRRPDMTSEVPDRWTGEWARVAFLCPLGVSPEPPDHPAVANWRQIETNAGWLCYLAVKRFTPARVWSSGRQVRQRQRVQQVA